MRKDLELTLEKTRQYYIQNNLQVPDSVVAYLKSFPKGLSRQSIESYFGLKCSEFVQLLNPNYKKPYSASERAVLEAERLGYTLLSDITLLKTNRDVVNLKCKECDYLHSTSITSMSGSTLGCPLCKSGNLSWAKRVDELKLICLDRLDSELISEVPLNQTGYVYLKHICGTEYKTQLVGVVSPNTTLRATCPNCRPSDRRVVYNGLTFGSSFELECYKKLQHLNPEIHVPYALYLNTSRRWVCDFKIGNYWVEVSNFKQDFKNYFANIIEKESLVESNNQVFFFVRSLKELDELISLM